MREKMLSKVNSGYFSVLIETLSSIPDREEIHRTQRVSVVDKVPTHLVLG